MQIKNLSIKFEIGFGWGLKRGKYGWAPNSVRPEMVDFGA
jgi:hypothetical protein